ncbi:MAG TPA: hypothetical protein VHR15_07290 [Ktedonobacterales bacterium]|jgi:hypothetical protein|nr:hypothetical protein [Ktedonobacterales bacterium]
MASEQELQELDATLTALLEAERASVEVEVALASAASEYQERAAFTAMGAEDIEACCALRERLQRDEDEVSHYISRVVFDILECEHYDDRLRAFAIHQREIGRRATEILETLDSESGLRRLLHEIVEAHVRHALWAERRAEEFAETRLLEFKGAGLGWVKMTPNVALVPASQRAIVTHRSTGADQAPSSAGSAPKTDRSKEDDETQDND